MLNPIRFSTLFLAWRARRAGTLDGRALIPHREDRRPPKYLLYLRDVGHWRAARLERRWHLYDLALYPAYVRAYRLCEQAQQALDEAESDFERAQALRHERGTERHIRALEEQARALRKARRRAHRAELALGSARARRQSRWMEFTARFHALAAEMDHLMQLYSDANIKGRDENDCPPGLLEESRPRLERTGQLRELDWTLPPRFSHLDAGAPAAGLGERA